VSAIKAPEWSAEDEDILWSATEQRWTLAYIAAALGRTRAEVEAHRAELAVAGQWNEGLRIKREASE
jgi:hypothetical protein